MVSTRLRFLAAAAALLLAGLADAATVSKTSLRTLRQPANPAITVVPGFTVTALSTNSLQWSWSTGSFTSSGLTGYKLYTSSAAGAYIPLALNASFYVDAGLGVNQPYTRWITVYDATDEGSDSLHLVKHTYALPPATFNFKNTVSTGTYLWWSYSSATAYAIETSTDSGTTWELNRLSFVPWQTIALPSNTTCQLRLGAVNHDDEITPGVYSVVKTTTTQPLTPTLTAVARSSYTIEWSWSTGPYTGTGITGYRLYKSTTTSDDGAIPEDNYAGAMVANILGAATTSWIEVYRDSGTISAAANSRHNRWLKAVGHMESMMQPMARAFTYAIAPATCTVIWPDPEPYHVEHVNTDSLDLNWSVRLAAGEASQYVIDYSTTGGFSFGVSSTVAPGAPGSVTGLTDNTKYDLRVGAINGDGLQTPANALNPFAYSHFYKVMTEPLPPGEFKGTPVTDTSIAYTWSTTTYRNSSYIAGYGFGEPFYDAVAKRWYVVEVASVTGIGTTSYTLDYLMTNSTHTRYVWAKQTDPAFAVHPNFPDTDYLYKHFGSAMDSTIGATFATPPNDVTFSTPAARSLTLNWRHPEVPATQYRVERATWAAEAGPWTYVGVSTANTFTDTGLTPYTTYAYRIGAINQLGVLTSGLSAATGGMRRDYSFVSSTMTRHVGPAMYGVVYGTGTISWSWINSTAGVLSYRIYSATQGVLADGLAAGATFWLETNLPADNERYTRSISSFRSNGEGELVEASSVTLAQAPAALTTSATGLHTIDFTWTANGTRYRVDRSLDLVTWTTLKDWADVFTSTGFADSGLRAATTHYYAVYAFNQDGAISLSSAVSAGIRTGLLPANLTQLYSTATAAVNLTAPLAAPGAGSSLTLTIPAGALSADNYVHISTYASVNPSEVSYDDLADARITLSPNGIFTDSMIELQRWDMYGAVPAANFAAPVRVKFTYPDATNDGTVDGTAVDEGTLSIFLLDPATLTWLPQRNTVIDRTANTAHLDVSHFSIYALGNIVSTQGDLSDIFAYPNPYRPGSSGLFGATLYGAGIVFEGLPAGAKVRIYNLAGGLMRSLDDPDGDGRALWDARNTDGSAAASGVYVYVVSAGGETKTGRVAIIK